MVKKLDKLEVKNVRKNYEGAPLLKGVSLSVESGETLCLLGRSGSGKSTLLRIIAGLETADEGEVTWNGESMSAVPAWQRKFGLMFQDYALFPHRSVEQNVAFGLRMQGEFKEDIVKRVHEALELVNMTGFEKRSVTDLSGGEQQRIALARALAPRPCLLMLDEPLAALDRALRTELQEELRALLHKTGIPAIYVTHDQEEAFMLGNRIAILAEGVIEQQGSPEEVYRRPLNRKVAEFLGMTNIVDGRVISLEPLIVETEIGRLNAIRGNTAYSLNSTVSVLLIQNPVDGKNQKNLISGKVENCIFRGEYFDNILSIGDQKIQFIGFTPLKIGSTQELSIAAQLLD